MPRPPQKKVVPARLSKAVDQDARPQNRGSRDQQPTVTLIIESARQVLLEHGHAGLTTRLVATTAGISPGNLSYHFPSKSELLQAVIARMLEDYSSQFESLVSHVDLQQGMEFQSLVDWLMKDTVSDETVRVFRELWAMSLHDQIIRSAVDDFYDQIIKFVSQMLHRVYPDADKTSISELVHLLALFTEGSSVIYGTRRRRAVGYERIRELITASLANVVPEIHSISTKKKSTAKAKRR